MDIKTLYICSRVGKSHVFLHKPDTLTCTMCPTNHFSFLTKIIDSSPQWKEVKKEFDIITEVTTPEKRFADFLKIGDDFLKKNQFADALQQYKNALELNVDNVAVKKKIEDCKETWKNFNEGLGVVTIEPPLLEVVADNEFGFAVLLMDASGSMDEVAFEDSSYTKKQLIAKTAAHGIFDMKDNKKSQFAYITGFMFDNEIKPIIPLNSIANIVKTYGIPENLEKYILECLNSKHGTTDINGALEVAYQQSKDFISGNLKGQFGDDYYVMYHAVTDTNSRKNIQVPNVRVFLYTDGLQFVNGKTQALKNPFKDSKDFNVDILMGGYFGAETGDGSEGLSELKEILSNCPEHGEKNFFVFDKPEKMGTLRNLFKMASGASGFCPECLGRVECAEEYSQDRVK